MRENTNLEMFVLIFDFTVYSFQCEIGGVTKISSKHYGRERFTTIRNRLLILSRISNGWSNFAGMAKCTNWKSHCYTRCMALSFHLAADWNVIILFILRLPSMFLFTSCSVMVLRSVVIALRSIQNLWTFFQRAFDIFVWHAWTATNISNGINILFLPFVLVPVIQCKRGDIEFDM